MNHGIVLRLDRGKRIFRSGPSGIGTLLILALLFFSQPSFAEDLLGAYGLALKNDPRFIGARYARAASVEKLSQARAGLLRTCRARGSPRKRGEHFISSDNTVTAGKSTIPTTDYSLSLVLPVQMARGRA
jgi:hypothetical protein